MQQTGQQDYYDEISLRELIEVLLKGKKTIAIITIISVLISGIASFWVIEPTYEAQTTLMASFATTKLTDTQRNNDDIEGILNSISTYPTMTIQTYKEQIKNPEILQNVIDELKLGENDITLDGLKNMIALETIKDTNLIAIKVENTDPELASKIANSVANNFTIFMSEMTKQQASKSSQFIEGQLEIEKQKVDEALVELKQFLSQPRGVDELRAESSSKLSLLTNYKTQLVQKEVELNKNQATLNQAEKELQTTPQKLTTKKSLIEDPILTQIVSENNNTPIKETTTLTMESEQINGIYTNLKNKVVNYKIQIAGITKEIEDIKNKIETTTKEVEAIRVELAEKEHKNRLIQRKVNLAQSTYDAFTKKYEETRIAESSQIGDSSILVVSKAITPLHPTSPNKMLNLAIAAVLGLMIGVFVAFFKEYWKTSAEAK